MRRAAPADELGALTATFSPAEWRLLGAIAVERALTLDSLSALASSLAEPGDLAEGWLATWVAAGLVVRVGGDQPLPAWRARDAVYAVRQDLQQATVRALHDRGELSNIALATRALLAGRSVADLTEALARGDWPGFVRAAARKRLPHALNRGEPNRAEWLRAALCEPFDPEWLERTWGARSFEVALRVVLESLTGPSPCTELLEWLRARPTRDLSEGDAQALANALCQHAVLRGLAPSVTQHLAALPGDLQALYRACSELLHGSLITAQHHLNEALGLASAASTGLTRSKASSLHDAPAVTPIPILMLLGRNTPEARAAIKRLLAPAGNAGAERGSGRALRRLLRYLEQPVEEHRRIDVFQLDAGAGAWEILISALTVHLHLEQAATRAGWARHLVHKGVEWQSAGYEWLGKQALLLAAELDRQYAIQELSALGCTAAELALAPRELRLWDLVQPKAEWQKTLDALAQLSETLGASGSPGRRVAWYIDMSDGSFSRPALQEYREETGAWSPGQRLPIADLHALCDELPPEDVRVLACSREYAGGRRELTDEAYELLIGHPRVYNGARPGAPIEVARGSCRIETYEEAGHLHAVIEPAGAKLGVNVVPERDDRLLVFRVTPDMQRVIQALPHGVRIPLSRELEFLEVLAKLSQSIEVRAPQLAAERSAPADATPCLRIAPQAGAWLVQAGVRPFGEQGRFFLAGVGRASVTVRANGARVRLERSLDLERSLLGALIAECPSLRANHGDESGGEGEGEGEGEGTDSWVFGTEAILGLLSELRETKVRHNLEWQHGSLRLGGKVSSKNLHAHLRTVKGWYIASGEVRVDENTHIPLGDLVRAPLLADGRFIRLPSGDYLELEQRIRRVVQTLASLPVHGRPRSPRDVELHPAALGALRVLAEPDSGIDVEDSARAWLARIDAVAGLELELPHGLKAELRPYQLEGYRWLCRLSQLGLGACLADDMGLGKTIQILALLLQRRSAGPALVVAPTSVCSNWLLELQRFAPELVCSEYTGKNRASELEALTHSGAGRVLICSYALLQQDHAELAAVSWATAVLDEAQFIKNPESLRAKAAFQLQASCRVAATGTPVENHSGDLWSIFHFINPGLLGGWAEFKRRFARPIERDGSRAAELELRQIVRPYVLRRLKRDVLADLPPITEVEHAVQLSADERTLYTLLRKQIYEKLFTTHGKRQHKLQILAEITRLRRFCCHPRLVFPEANNESSKIDTLLELVEELRENQHRALVFSQYVDFLQFVREALAERGIDYEYLDGSTPRADRQARVDAFQNGGASLFLISLKAGGFGLNLTAADYVVHLDPWWNPAVTAQATDRAHRIGQERKVTVYKLVTRHTIEEDILKLHGKKRRLAQSVLDDEAGGAELSADELLELLRLERA